MRTTLAIDDDVFAAAKQLAERERKTIGEVISLLARKGLSRSARSPRGERNGVRLLAGTQGRRGGDARTRKPASRWHAVTTTLLLRIDVFIVLVDPFHVHHEQAHEWFGRKNEFRCSDLHFH
jgi:hypothetical protein